LYFVDLDAVETSKKITMHMLRHRPAAFAIFQKARRPKFICLGTYLVQSASSTSA